ncbi:hypothetical protein [Clostridium beijerinckii]|uniref:hypothetical protein n=1 Tax=Clostridium beijerinckii TaxID=1520 RepID=UPI001570575D|nr:hypothetical protein [Clostridium beijerinckii]
MVTEIKIMGSRHKFRGTFLVDKIIYIFIVLIYSKNDTRNLAAAFGFVLKN